MYPWTAHTGPLAMWNCRGSVEQSSNHPGRFAAVASSGPGGDVGTIPWQNAIINPAAPDRIFWIDQGFV